jgi:hypothetical protein
VRHRCPPTVKRQEDFATRKRVKAFSDIERAPRLKLDRLDAATSWRDLAALPGNHFEALKGDRVSHSLNGTDSITRDIALRLGHFFGRSAEFWLNLQSLYDLRIAQQKAGESIKTLPTLKRSEPLHA